MLLVGLTGGIGSGKSTVARMLGERGAVVFDADELARRAVEPGTPGHRHVVEVFGRRVLAEGGEIDRAKLGAVVFAEPEYRERLEHIVHPEVFRLLELGLSDLRDTDRIVVFDAALLVETGFHAACDVVVVVTAPESAQVERVMAARGLNEDEARSRIAAQVSSPQRLEVADRVIDNGGTLAELERNVAAVWDELRRRAAGAPPV